MMFKTSTLSRALALVLGALLAACGGGTDGVRLPDASGLATPSTVRATANTAGVALSWDASAGAGSYAVYRCPVPAGVTADLCAATPQSACGAPIGVTSASFSDVPPQPAPQAYCYRVSACVDAGGQACGPIIASVASARRITAPPSEARAVITDDGRQVVSGLSTSLQGLVLDGSGTPTYQWTQEGGPKVTLAGADTDRLSFTAPTVGSNTMLSFELRVTDGKGIARPAKAAVTVVPPANVSVKVGHASRLAQAGHQVSLHAEGSAPGLTYSWRQLSPASPLVALSGADTANPSFVAPTLPAGGLLRFEVTATDPLSGRNASARTAVEVQYPVPALVPSPTPGLVPQPIPVAAPLLQPLLMAQPLQVPQPAQAVPVPSPVLVPPKMPPQALLLIASPAVVATGGTAVPLGMTATGGRAPYQWSWTQTGGPAATLSGASQDVPTVQVPAVTSTQTLTFQAVLTDADGTQRSAEAVVQATLPPQPPTAGDLVPTPITALAPRLVTVGEPAPVLVTSWTGLTVVQTDGPQLTITQQPNATGTVITVVAPLLVDHSAQANLRVTGLDAAGQTRSVIVPVIVMRPPALAPTLVAPPQVTLNLVPKQDDPLVVLGSDGHSVNEGQLDVTVVLYARGGKGSASYSYRWDYLKAVGGPDIVLRNADRPNLKFDAPQVDRPITLNFRFQVTDGAQVAQRNFTLYVNDVAPSATVGALASLTVQGGAEITLNVPAPTGGLPFPRPAPPYVYSVVQTGGPALPAPPREIPGRPPGNFLFTAPILSAGAPDQVLSFELTTTDRIGNLVKLTQQVTVTAPPPPLVAALHLPPSFAVSFGHPLQVHGDASGGSAPYSYAWTFHLEAQPIAGKAPFTLADQSASGQSPSVDVFSILGGRSRDVASYRATVTLRVTDADGRTAETQGALDLVITELFRPGSEALLCGDLDADQPCSDLDLVLAMTSKCPDTQPYAMNDIIKNGNEIKEFRRCVHAPDAYNLWWVQTRNNPFCRNFDPSTAPDQITCHIACYGNGCNVDTNPPENVLVGPPGADGLLEVGKVPPPSSPAGATGQPARKR